MQQIPVTGGGGPTGLTRPPKSSNTARIFLIAAGIVSIPVLWFLYHLLIAGKG